MLCGGPLVGIDHYGERLVGRLGYNCWTAAGTTGKERRPKQVMVKVSQETLADMIGTTRSRVSFFMNKFRKLGFIDYSGGLNGRLEVHSSLLNIVLHETPGITKDP